MKVLNLRCAHDHHFEGWFGSEADYVSQHERGLIACPLCADTGIQRLPSAPHVHTSGARRVMAEVPVESAVAASSNKPSGSASNAVVPVQDHSVQLTQQAAWMRAVQHVIANTVDVGPRFAEEARRIHYGEKIGRASCRERVLMPV